ncbi:CheB methylesterase domain-containing protein [Lederbergia galactosidilytica]|uniref:CheB methylesterase domain-containing protein n=1 Tax=Lederbergia galactosidilytica TaxID=217031 RepID=UPI000717390D|nr:CheB methylesterase domain-containing protein [Lederbergia galactosidilytica]MBP1913637.1 two-component system chemotaxis response regulator CheB [Lederbergia galactosidilytica]
MHSEDQYHTIVCIGTSTGGPRALQTVLSELPRHLPAPIVIVQHMPPKFTKSLANRLNTLCEIQVKEAEDGEILQKGTAYIAPGGKQMSLISHGKEVKIRILETEPVNGHRPSVDVLFQSVSRLKKHKKLAIIMTGMGSDGKKGIIDLKEDRETIVMAESKDSCIVYGMPRAAIETGLVDSVTKLDDIANNIMKLLG